MTNNSTDTSERHCDILNAMQAVLGTKEVQNMAENEYLRIEVSLENGELIARAGIQPKIS